MAERNERDATSPPWFLAGGGATGQAMREAVNRTATPLGRPADWPLSLRAMTALMLASQQPMCLAWGPDLTFLYNDAYAPFLGERHPAAMGRPLADVWSDVWADIAPLVDLALAGESTRVEDLHLVMMREGRPQDTWWTFAYTPIRDDDGRVAGLLNVCSDSSARVRDRRRRAFWSAFDAQLNAVSEVDAVLEAAAEAAGRHFGAQLAGFVQRKTPHTWTWRDDWRANQATPSLSAVGAQRVLDALNAGETVVWPAPESSVDDAETALIAAPIFRHGACRAGLYVMAEGGRAWTADDASLLREIGEATWSALDRVTWQRVLEESEARYRQIVESADDFAIVTFDERGVINGWNRGARKLLGYSDEEAIGQPGEIFFTEEDRAAGVPDREMNHARIERRTVNERWHLRKDGSRFWGSGLMMRFDGAKGGFLKMFRDRTLEHEADAALRVSEARLRELNADLERKVSERALDRGTTWDVSPDLLSVIDANGVFETVNPAWTTALGWSAEEVRQRPYSTFVHPDDLGASGAAFAEVTKGNPVLRFENRYRTKAGDWRWLSWVAVPEDGKVYCRARDVTAEREQAAELAQRTAERDRLWTLSEDLLARADYSGRMSAVSPAWTRVLGWSEAELLARPYVTFMHPDDAGPTLEGLARMGETHQPARFENRIATIDGGWKPIEWTVAPDPDGVNFIAVGRDLSSVKAREAELDAAQQALRQSQKLEAMGQLTGGVAHDFNNLLTPIIGSLDTLIRRGVGNERERRLMDGALQSAERAKVLVQRLLAFARRQPLQPSAVDLSELVHGMAGLLGSTLSAMVDIRVQIAPDLPPVMVDPNQLEMALLNLAVNARDAMPAGGVLTVAADRETVGAQHLSRLAPGEYVRLCVADTGHGMDEATLARAIEPFFSTKGIGKGTGLGLSMVHGLAAQLGGALTLRSRLQEGTTVELWLPVSIDPAQGGAKPVEASPAPATRGSVLLVDDEDLVRMSIADMLHDMGYDVIEATSGAQALQKLQGGLRPDVLVSDHMMPGMNGVELAQAARSLLPELPVLIVSGYAEADGVAASLPRLTKPFRNAEFAERLASLLPVKG